MAAPRAVAVINKFFICSFLNVLQFIYHKSRAA